MSCWPTLWTEIQMILWDNLKEYAQKWSFFNENIKNFASKKQFLPVLSQKYDFYELTWQSRIAMILMPNFLKPSFLKVQHQPYSS